MTTLRVTSRQEIIERTRELETGLRAADAMTRTKGEFLANMSHEIRTPMNGILGMTDLLFDTNLDKTGRNASSSNRCHGRGDSMLTTINDILDVSKIDAGKMELLRS